MDWTRSIESSPRGRCAELFAVCWLLCRRPPAHSSCQRRLHLLLRAALLPALVHQSQSFRAPAAPEPPFSVWPEKRGPKRGHPASAPRRHPACEVRESGPGFSNGHPVRAKRSRHPCRLPLRGLSSPPHRRTGAPVEQRAILARTFRKGRSKAKAPRVVCHVPSQGQELQSQLLSDHLRPIAVTAVSCAGKTCGQSRLEVRTLTSQKKLTLNLFLAASWRAGS